MSRRSPALSAALVLLVTGIVFVPGLNGVLLWDDHLLLTQAPKFHQLSALKDVFFQDFLSIDDPEAAKPYYRPIVRAAYVLQWHFFGNAPFGYHVVNLLLHLACCALGFVWMLRRLRAEAPQEAAAALPVAAVLGTLVFALHPSRPESVTWVSGSTDLWMLAWTLLGFVLWDSFTKTWQRLLLAGPAFVLGLFSKEPAIVVPVLLLSDLLLRGGRRDVRRQLAHIGGLFLLMAGAMAFRSTIVSAPSAGPLSRGVGDLLQRTLCTLGMYVGRLVWPWVPSIRSGFLPSDAAGRMLYPAAWVWLGALVSGGLLLAAVVALRRPTLRPYLADVLWIVLPLAPALNILPLQYEVLIADRMLYWPLLGAGALVARLVLPRLSTEDWRRTSVLGATACVLLGFGLVTTNHLRRFLSEQSLWAYEYELHPTDPTVLEWLASSLLQEGEPARAQERAEELLLTTKAHGGLLRGVLIWAESRMQQLSDADQGELRRIRALLDRVADPDKDRVVVPIRGTPMVVLLSQEYRRALPSGQQARLHLTRATAHARTLSLAVAEQELRQVLSIWPAHTAAQDELVRVLASEERWEEAQRALTEAAERLRIPEGNPNLAEALRRGHQLSAAPPSLETTVSRALLHGWLGSPARGRQLLESLPEQDKATLDYVHASVQLHLFDKRVDLARASLEAARERFPERRGEVDAALAELARPQASP